MHAPPLLERDTLLALASDAQRQAAGRREGQILLVVGEAGIGKTSFIAALRARAQDEGLRLLESACEPLGVPRPLGPLRDLAREAFESADYKEGTRAFLEKRPPKFQGR